NGGQKEAGDGRRGVTEDHLMDVPDDRRQKGRNGQPRGVGGEPERDRGRGPEGGAEKEGPKPGGEDRRTGVRPIARNSSLGLLGRRRRRVRRRNHRARVLQVAGRACYIIYV